MLSGRVSCPTVQVSFTKDPGSATAADTVAVGLHSKEELPEGVPQELSALIASGEAKESFKSLALCHAGGRRWLLVGLGPRSELTPERARVAAAVARDRMREMSTRDLCWQAPLSQDGEADPAVLAALVQGTVLADYRFERYKSDAGQESSTSKRLETLTVSGPGEHSQTVSEALLVAEEANRARDLQNSPGNELTPTALGKHAEALAEEIEHLSVEVEGREGILARSMGAFAAVAQGSAQEPALITMRYDPPGIATGGTSGAADAGESAGAGGEDGGRAPVLGIVGKAVTFDSGGISLKPGAKMSEMKFDMSGGAAAIQAIAAIARLRLPIRVIAVIGATENLPSGTAVKPGDIVTASNGKTIEINNTDAEGRLVLADCLCHAVSLGAERIVDLATLTGAVIIALGSTHAGLISNDDELAEAVSEAGRRSGEIVWRLPMHEEYAEMLKGAYADLDNAPEARKAGTIVGATFLSNFVGETPWAHLDIAGSAWDLGRAYAPKHASGYGVRLLVQLARSYC